jgi:hypothetical protein
MRGASFRPVAIVERLLRGEERTKLGRRRSHLHLGHPSEVGLIAKSEIRREPRQVRISSGETLERLLHP